MHLLPLDYEHFCYSHIMTSFKIGYFYFFSLSQSYPISVGAAYSAVAKFHSTCHPCQMHQAFSPDLHLPSSEEAWKFSFWGFGLFAF